MMDFVVVLLHGFAPQPKRLVHFDRRKKKQAKKWTVVGGSLGWLHEAGLAQESILPTIRSVNRYVK